MKTMILASSNKHKIEEFRLLFPDYQVLALADIGFDGDIIEDGETFLENSVIKAKVVQKFLNEKGVEAAVVADDTGLCVDALDGAPGVYSARYSGDHDFTANRKKLLDEMKDKADRNAHFTTTIVYMEPDRSYHAFEGRVDGEILTQERGDTSFGYNCLFFSFELGKTFGEATLEERSKVSHRGRAVEKLKKFLHNEKEH